LRPQGEATRARLLSLLSEACELEHALSCSYLYAAFSIKKDLEEGLSWEQQQLCRRWASQIFHVAAEEMLHLAQAWNLLTAVGGSPYYARPNFPQPAKHFPLPVALLLRRFDAATVERFTYYENPVHEHAELPRAEVPPGAGWPIDESFSFASVGQLYGECRRILETLDERNLFLGELDRQVGRDLVDFPNLVEVTGRSSAVRAIEMITEQGEGTPRGRQDSHYDVFVQLLEQVRALPSTFDPARPVVDNPYVRSRRDQVVPHVVPSFASAGITATALTDRMAILSVDLFDDAYVSMLQSLAYVFSNATKEAHELKRFASAALDIMMTVIRPLGEAITRMPSGAPGTTAGPTFAMTRHAQLPSPPEAARRVFGERLQQLAGHASELRSIASDLPGLAAQLRGVETNLGLIATRTAM
jgi:hypothetical protein